MNLKIVTQADVDKQTAKGKSGVKIGGDFNAGGNRPVVMSALDPKSNVFDNNVAPGNVNWGLYAKKMPGVKWPAYNYSDAATAYKGKSGYSCSASSGSNIFIQATSQNPMNTKKPVVYYPPIEGWTLLDHTSEGMKATSMTLGEAYQCATGNPILCTSLGDAIGGKCEVEGDASDPKNKCVCTNSQGVMSDDTIAKAFQDNNIPAYNGNTRAVCSGVAVDLGIDGIQDNGIFSSLKDRSGKLADGSNGGETEYDNFRANWVSCPYGADVGNYQGSIDDGISGHGYKATKATKCYRDKHGKPKPAILSASAIMAGATCCPPGGCNTSDCPLPIGKLGDPCRRPNQNDTGGTCGGGLSCYGVCPEIDSENTMSPESIPEDIL